jgi:hypothetical protein
MAASVLETVTARGAGTGVSDDVFHSLGSSLATLLGTELRGSATHAPKLSSSLTSLVRATWVDMRPGEEGLSVRQPALNMTTSVGLCLGPREPDVGTARFE